MGSKYLRYFILSLIYIIDRANKILVLFYIVEVRTAQVQVRMYLNERNYVLSRKFGSNNHGIKNISTQTKNFW